MILLWILIEVRKRDHLLIIRNIDRIIKKEEKSIDLQNQKRNKINTWKDYFHRVMHSMIMEIINNKRFLTFHQVKI